MADIVSDTIDAARMAAVSAALGPQRLGELMLILGGRVQKLAEAAELLPESAEAWLAALHQSRGSAASLGLVALAAGLARVEALGRQANVAEHDREAAWEAVRQVGRALPDLWEEAQRVKKGLLF
jgi:HPt (histidine-containing phosphotransfer) domain-containing protein